VSLPESQGHALQGIAIVGMAGRFPGARSVAEFWRNQIHGIEAISHFRVEDLEIPDAVNVAQNPNYVRSRSVLDDVDMFEPEFFGILPKEAELLDPQQRLFLECCWQAFEDAGYDPAVYDGPIGVYAGSSTSTYFLSRLCTRPGFIRKFVGGYQVDNYPEMMGNNLDFLSTRVSYKFNLRGPAFTMQAGCSTSLVAICQACQSLLTYQSDMALAGGTSITFPQKRGSYYQEGGMTSPDGHCRTFDAEAQGTVFGGGVAVVLLKRLEDAIREGDQIYAVIRGFAVNNDGAAKVGYTAPSVEGQASVIALAQAAAGIDPSDVGYIEAHGTGTPLGDPIELAALAQAFRTRTSTKRFCVVGTAKTNVGHLDIAAGVTGLIHATHVVRHGVFPPTLHFNKPNPKFDLENSPFYVNTKLSEWKANSKPRRAGVSAFGVGGTNAHVVLEQAPAQVREATKRPLQLIVLSARSQAALEQATDNLAQHLKANPDVSLADVAWTLQAGRRPFSFRRFVVARDITEASNALSERDPKRVRTRTRGKEDPRVCFLFPGQGSQHPNMAREVYQTEPVFRQTVDRCAELLRPHLGEDLRELLYPRRGSSDEASRRVTDTVVAQPAIFTIEYALAQLWMSWGIHPQVMLGHSIGEFVAACLAGVFTLEDALSLVAARGRMMQELPEGGMLSVRLPELEVRGRLNGKLSLAAVNAPFLCVVSGPLDALDEFEQQLSSAGVASRRLVTSHAFHSAMMDPILAPFTAQVKKVHLKPPQIPYISGVTGKWISEKETTDPSYWASHFRQAVQFSAGVTELRKNPNDILLEVGPGNVLATLARQHNGSSDQPIISSLSDGFSGVGDELSLMSALGSLWLAGAQPDWKALYGNERRLRVSLPTYPFERKRYWLPEPAADEFSTQLPAASAADFISTETSSPDLEKMELVTTPAQADAVAVATTAFSRTDRIRAALAEIFEDLSGVNLSQADGATTFLEMGFDSLFLTQVTQALQAKFGLKVTFRQLLGDQCSLSALAEYMDAKLPANVLPAVVQTPAVTQQTRVVQAPVPAITPSAELATPPASGNGGTPMPESSVERLMREQLQAMNQLFAKQLETLRGSSPVAAPSAAIAVPVAAAPKPAATIASPAPLVAVPPAQPEVNAKEEFKPFGPYKPPQKGVSGNVTPQQEQGLQRLKELYIKRTAKSKAMTQQYRLPLADPRVVSGFRSQWKEIVYPIVTVRSKGSRLWDVDGNEYIDILNGFGPIMLGHRPDFVERAIEKQLHEGFEIGPQTPLAGEVAKMFCDMTGNERMTFCNTGSEAVMAALRVARTVTGRNKVVLFAGAYHGMFDEVLVKGFKKGGVPQSAPVAPGIPREKVANVTVLDYGTAESLEWIRQNAKDLAAVLVEPVQSRHPHLQPREFLHEIRRITEECGSALIFDEVVTGFRVHPGGCQALFGIRSDLATYGKVVAGGMPIGILAGKAQFMDALDGGQWQFGDESYPEVGVTFFAGTFVRHPLTVAAVKAVLQHFKEEGPALQEQLSQKTAGMVKRINECFERNNVPSRVEHFGSIFYFGFPSEERFTSLFYYFLRAKGIHILEGFPCFLTTTHTDADIEQIVSAFSESVAEMQKAGFFPAASGIGQVAQSDAHPVSAAVPVPVLEAALTEPQLEVWLSDQLGEEASCSFNESFSLQLRGKLNEAAFKPALQDVLARHDALRATFSREGDRQYFSPKLDIKVPTVDLSELAPAEREARVRQIINDDAHNVFSLCNGPLVRAQLLKMEEQHHLLIFTSHHIVCDGWSTNVLLDELAKAYNAKNHGATAELPVPMSFVSYAKSQLEFLNGPEGAEVEKYWLKQFEKPAPLLDLPTDRPRPAVKEYKGATYRWKIGASTYNNLKKLGAKQKCTLFVTLLSGFQILLSRLSGQDDIVVGVPTAGQSLLDEAVLVGHCVNFIPLRGSLTGNPTAADFLNQMKKTVLDGYDHQNYTYGRLVRKLALQRDPSRLPLMEIQFNLERVGDDLAFEELKVDVDPNPKSFVNFDIFLNVVESKNGLTLDCDYNTGLFDEATIGRWLGHYQTVLEGMISEVDWPISKLPLLAESEHRQLAEWNATEAAYSRNACVNRLFEAQAKATPDAIAAVFESQELTYAELDRRANQLANHLQKLGVQPGVLVGIFVERSLDMIIGLLGVLKAGGAYVPMDPTYPLERIQFVLGDAEVPILLTQEKLAPNLPSSLAHVIHLDTDWSVIERESSDAPRVSLTSEELAYVIYTSGSTGKPKGVEIQHRAVVSLLSSMRKKPGLDAKDTLLAVTTLSFDIAGLELFLPLCAGAKLVIASREAAADGNQLLARLISSGTTVMQATPITWKLLLEAGWNGTPQLKALCGGEAFPRELANELLKRAVSVWNMYGPTETTIWSSTLRVTAGEGPVPIGPPIDNTQFYVLDTQNELAPIGVPGELHIGGDGLARGYFQRPELTTEKFIRNAFSSAPDSRLYKTGDLVRRNGDGSIEFLGRLDHQVKLRGFRIELGEIETVLARYPGVREAIVIVREDVPGDRRLVAYLTSDQQALTVVAVREFLTGKLPNYMLPSAVVRMDSMPLTPNGKIDRKALPAPDSGRTTRKREFVAPSSDQEKTLASIWAEVLHLEQVGVNDNLFELGADSLHIFQIAARAGKAGIKIAPAQFLKHRTITALLDEIAKNGNGHGKAAMSSIVPVSREKYRVKTVLSVPQKESVK
jgi:amino acid adenylation domain-containing protein